MLLPGSFHLSPLEKLALTLLAGKVMYDELTDGEKGLVDKLEDAGSIAIFSGVVFQLWVPVPVKIGVMGAVSKVLKPLAPPVIGFVAGYIIGAEIAEELYPGTGRETFKEFYGTPTEIPEKALFIGETIYQEIILPPMVAAAEWYVAGVDRLIENFQMTWELTRPRSLWG